MYNLGLKGGILCGKSKCIKILSLYLILFPNLNAIDLNVRVSKNQLTDTETKKAKEHIKEVVGRLETKLQPSTETKEIQSDADGNTQKPDEWWKIQSHGKTDSDLAIAIIVENYSKYKLVSPKEFQERSSSKSLIPPQDVLGGQYATVVYEAYNDWLRGSVSWQIYYQEENRPVMKIARSGSGRVYGRRLNVAYYIPWAGSCRNIAGTRNAHSIHIIQNHIQQNETTRAYMWDKKDATRRQKKWKKGSYAPKHHPQIYLEFEQQNSKTDEYRFLVHSKMYGGGCRPTLKVQLFPGEGPLGDKMIYDFSEPLPVINLDHLSPEKHVQAEDAFQKFSMAKMFIYIASGVGFLAIAIVVGITCKKFVNKKKREDKFRRPYDEPQEYRAGRSLSGENDDEED